MTSLLISSCAAIVIGGLVDCWYTVKVNLQPSEEYNPMARLILRRWGVNGLVAGKGFGTGLVIALLWLGFFSFPVAATVAGVAVGGAMLLLAFWLWLSSKW